MVGDDLLCHPYRWKSQAQSITSLLPYRKNCKEFIEDEPSCSGRWGRGEEESEQPTLTGWRDKRRQTVNRVDHLRR